MVRWRIKTNRQNNPTFDRAYLLWQAARCWADGQNLELARTQPNMRGQVARMVESIKAPTIDETQLSIITNRKGGALDIPGKFEFLTPMARALALAQ